METSWEFWLECALFLLMALTTLGLVIPLFPGFIVLWLIVLGYLLLVGWQGWNLVFFVVLTLLAIAGMLVDNVAVGMGAAKGGASWKGILLALLAGLVATLLFPPFGGFVAAPAVLFLVEYYRRRDLDQTWSALKGLAIGWGWAVVARLTIGVLMVALWSLWAWMT